MSPYAEAELGGWTVADKGDFWVAVGTVAVLIFFGGFAAGGYTTAREYEAKKAAQLQQLRPAPQAPSVAATRWSCSKEEVQDAKEHLQACYRRKLSDRTKPL